MADRRNRTTPKDHRVECRSAQVVAARTARRRLSILYAAIAAGSLAAAARGQAPASQPVTAPPVMLPARMEELERPLRDLIRERVEAVRSDALNGSKRAELGLAYEANGLWVEAEAAFRAAVDLDPRLPLALLHLGIAQQQIGQSESAFETFARLTREFPDVAYGFDRLARLLIEAGRWDEAERAARQLSALSPQTPFGAMHLAEVKLARKDYAGALELLRSAVKQAPGDRRLHYLLGMALRGLGQLKEAEWELRLGVAGQRRYLEDSWSAGLIPLVRTTRGINEYARQFIDAGQPDAAAKLLESALQESPGNVALLDSLALAYLGMRQPQRALAILQPLARAQPARASVAINLAAALAEVGRLEEALTQADAAALAFPQMAGAHLRRGQILIRLKRPGEAYSAFRTAVQCDASNPAVHLALGQAATALRQLDAAKGHFQTLVRVSPTFLPGYLNLAETCIALGQWDEAAAAMQVPQRLAPNVPEVAALTRRIAARGRE